MHFNQDVVDPKFRYRHLANTSMTLAVTVDQEGFHDLVLMVPMGWQHAQSCLLL
ncbi:hypothetical protein D3C71_2235750 [compost metagenome]